MGSERLFNRAQTRREKAELKKVCRETHPPVAFSSSRCPVCLIRQMANTAVEHWKHLADMEGMTKRALQWGVL